MSAITEHLTMVRELHRRANGGEERPSFAKFLDDHGRRFPTGPETFAGPRMTPKQCFMNAGELAVRDRSLTYCEGYVDVGLPIQHAWVVNPAGVVIDPTLDKRLFEGDPMPSDYFGVPFRTDYLLRTRLKTGYAALIEFYNSDLAAGAVPVDEFLERAAA